jgi:hypothetical protein
MLNPPSVNQITSAYTGNMPQLSKRVNDDKKANGGIAQDLRMLMAEADMAKAIANSQNQAALQQPQNPPTVAQGVHDRLRQLTQGQPRMQPQASQGQFQGQTPAPQPQAAPNPTPQGLPQLQGAVGNLAQQGINQLPANVGQAYANGGIIGYAEGDYVDERNTLRRMEAATYDQTNPVAKAPMTEDEIIRQAMLADPAVKRQEAEARRNAITRDTSAHDRLMAEYESEKNRLKPPEQGLDSFMELLSKIAVAPKGMGSLHAGAYGVQKAKEEQEAKDLRRHELTKQMLDVSQKKADLGYQQKMDVFTAGESAEAAAIKDKYAAAINRSTNQMERDKLAQQMEMELQKLAVHKQQVAAMNKPPAFQQIYTELQKLQPNADKSELFKQAVSMAGLSSKQDSAEAQMLDKLNDAIKQYDAAEAKLNFVKLTDPKQYAIDKGALDKKRDETEKLRSQIYARIGGQGLPDLAIRPNALPTDGGYTVSAGGKTYSFPTAEAAEKFKQDAGVK